MRAEEEERVARALARVLVVTENSYDLEGRRWRHRVSRGTTLLYQDSVVFDAAGRARTGRSETMLLPQAANHVVDVRTWYGGLGAVSSW